MRRMAEEVGFFSVWAQPSSSSRADELLALQPAMEKLRSQFGGPKFEPHVTVLGVQKLPLQHACDCLQAACRSLPPFTVRLTQVDCGSTFYQCVYMLVDKSQEVMQTNQQVWSYFGLSRSDEDYMPHLSLLYGDPTHEERQEAKRLVEKEFGHQLCNKEFPVSSLCLYSTDTNDKQLESWRKVAEFPLAGNSIGVTS